MEPFSKINKVCRVDYNRRAARKSKQIYHIGEQVKIEYLSFQPAASFSTTKTKVNLENLQRFGNSNTLTLTHKFRLNFTAQNDIEFDTRVRPLLRRYNTTVPLRDTHQAKTNVKTKTKSRKKRSLPATFDYWENEVGLSTPRDQLDCGSCWSFTNVQHLE